MKDNSVKKNPLNIFYSYAHKNRSQRQTLSKYLAPFRRANSIKEWSDANIEAGEEFEKAINENIYASDIIILVISPDFINSDYCWLKEMPEALKLHKNNKARVIPVIIEPISIKLKDAPFGPLTAVPTDGKPISKWADRKNGWTDAAISIGDIVNNWKVKNIDRNKTVPAKVTAITKQNTTEPAIQQVTKITNSGKKKVQRIIYDAEHKINLPGKLIRKEGDQPAKDSLANIVYDNLGKIYDFFLNMFGRNSVDNKGLPVIAIIRYGKNYNNAFWDGRNIVIGDGSLLKNLHGLDPLVIEFTKAINQYQSNLEYWGQSGSLVTASGHIFASLLKQYFSNQTSQEASWIIGEDILENKGITRGLFSVSEPGTAYYKNPDLGSDTGISNVRDMLPTHTKHRSFDDDNGGIHRNCGIPGRAFYLASLMIGGHAWEKAGKVWYESFLSENLKKTTDFLEFAKINLAVCDRLYGKNSLPRLAFERGWELVGVNAYEKIKKTKTKSAKKKK